MCATAMCSGMLLALGMAGNVYAQSPTALASAKAHDSKPVSLQVGVQQLMELPQGLQRMAVGDDSVVGVQVQRGTGGQSAARLLLTPLKPGTTSLMVWPTGQNTPSTYVLKVRPYVDRDVVTANSLTDLAAQQAATASKASENVLPGGALQLKSNVVQVDVKVVEINKDRMQQAGLNLFSTRSNSHGFSFGVLSAGRAGQPEFGTGGMLAPNASSPFSQAFGLLMEFGKAGLGLNLGMLEGSGMAKVLAEPSLVAISGQSANFLAGGEIPIPMSQGNGSVSIEYKTYGVGLTVSPTVLDDNRIVLKVAPESSELDYANAVTLQSTAVPAITTRRADTTVELGDGESFVIGGLVSQSTTSTVDRVPVLSQIPVLGTLFKSQSFSRKDRELVIVVTPRLVKPLAANVALDAHLPGANLPTDSSRSFWGHFVGATGRNDTLPGFSQ